MKHLALILGAGLLSLWLLLGMSSALSAAAAPRVEDEIT